MAPMRGRYGRRGRVDGRRSMGNSAPVANRTSGPAPGPTRSSRTGRPGRPRPRRGGVTRSRGACWCWACTGAAPPRWPASSTCWAWPPACPTTSSPGWRGTPAATGRAGRSPASTSTSSARWAIPGGTRHPSGAAPALPRGVRRSDHGPARRGGGRLRPRPSHRALVLEGPPNLSDAPVLAPCARPPPGRGHRLPPPPRRGHVARSTATAFPYPSGCALWERYNRLLLEHAGGMPVLLTSYDDLVGDPVGWSATAGGFLAGLGFEPCTGTEDEVRRFVDPELRHSHRRARSTPRPCRRDPSRRGPRRCSGRCRPGRASTGRSSRRRFPSRTRRWRPCSGVAGPTDPGLERAAVGGGGRTRGGTTTGVGHPEQGS